MPPNGDGHGCTAIIAGCICGPTSTAVRRNAPGWYSVLIVVVHAAVLPTACRTTAWKIRCWPCGNEKCLTLRTARTGSIAGLRTAVRSRPWGLCWSGIWPCYAGNLPDTLLSQIFANAKGRYGSTRDYVEQTLNALRSHAMPDRNLEARFRRCHSR